MTIFFSGRPGCGLIHFPIHAGLTVNLQRKEPSRCTMLKSPVYSLAPLLYMGMHPVNFP